MWLRRVDGGCLSYGAPALPPRLHLLTEPENVNLQNIMKRSRTDLNFQQCELSYF